MNSRGRHSTILRIELTTHREVEEPELLSMLDPTFQTQLAALRAKLAMCSNLLEHLTDSVGLTRACTSIVEPAGLLPFTDPYSYPYHLDPIDTLYRAGPDEIRRFLSNFSCLGETVVPDTTYLDDFMSENTSSQLICPIGGDILKFPYLLFADIDRFEARYHIYYCLFRRYRSTVVLLRRPALDGHVSTEASMAMPQAKQGD
jgi:hypothetical protein